MMNFEMAINKYALGMLNAEDLSVVAQHALDSGLESPALCQLATAEGSDSYKLNSLFVKAIEELGMSRPSRHAAGLFIARTIASDILAGHLSPYVGAKRIWNELYTSNPELTELIGFVGLASEYEDDHKNRDKYYRDIISECKMLLSA
jgi:hypothetical protein